ncbi:hypothetical protein [Nostoc sp.]
MTRITISDLNPSESILYELTDEEMSWTHGGLLWLLVAAAILLYSTNAY